MSNEEFANDIGDKKSDSVLINGHRELEDTFNAFHDLVAIIDLDHHIKRVNKAMACRLDGDPEDFVGRKCFSLVHGTDAPPEFCPHSKLLTDSQYHVNEFPIESLQGDFSVSVSPIFNDQTQLQGCVHVVKDITEKKKLEDSSNLLAAIVESSNNAIIGKDLDAKITTWNSTAKSMYGYSRDEIIGKSISTLIPSNLHDDLDYIMNKIKDGESIEQYDTVRKRKNGSMIDVSLSISPIINSEGNIIGASTIAHDITERKRAEEHEQELLENEKQLTEELQTSNEELQCTSEEIQTSNEELECITEELQNSNEELRIQRDALRRSEEKYRNIIENLQNAYIRADINGNIIMASPSAARMYEFDSPEGMIGISALSLYKNPENRKTIMEELEVKGKLKNYESVALRKDGTYFQASLNVQFHYDQGQIMGTEAFVSDITEFKKAEFERETSNKFLIMVNECTSLADLISSSIEFFKLQSGCEAVGIRLNSGEDYPYYETQGFNEKFVRLENYLCSYNKQGSAHCDSEGNPIMECMCGNVICGRFDPSLPFFTNKGSFWTNSTTKLLSSTSEDDRQARTRNRCNGEGYESVALLPLVSGIKTLGLLQLNDRSKNLFTRESILIWERLAGYLSVAMAKFQAEELKQRLLENEQQITEELQTTNEELQCITEEYQTSNEELKIQNDTILQINTALQDSEERFHDLADNIPNLAWMADETGWIFWYNKQWYEYTGTTFEEMQGWGWKKVHHPDYVKSVTEEWSLSIKEGNPYENVFPLRGADGNYRWFLTRILPIRDDQGRIQRWFGSNTDITENKLNEKKLENIMKELKRSNNELQRFAYVSSHDLQEPLRMITSFTQLLERRYKNKLDADADDYIGFIVDGAKRMKSLIDDLLTFSRLNTQPHEEIISLETVLNTALLNLKTSIDENNVKITHDQLPQIIGDSSRMVQVFQNLILNAIKFNNNEKPEIHISVKKEKNRYIFNVKDNGIGMDSKHLERIFTIFQRLHTRQEYEGTGIGLAIVQKIVQQHGGEIWVESKPGEGSTFHFTIVEK